MGCLEGAQGLEVGPVAVGDFFLYPVASLESWVLDGISRLGCSHVCQCGVVTRASAYMGEHKYSIAREMQIDF